MDSNLNKNKTARAKEFLDNINILNLLNINLSFETNKYLLSIKICNSDSILTCQCVFKILEKEKIWVKTLNYDEFGTYKSKMGFDGNWKTFFNTIELAFNKSQGGSITIRPYKDKKEASIQVTIFHPLSEDLKVKSEIIFDKFYSNSTDEFRNFNFDLMLELYESKELHKSREKEKMTELANSNDNCANKNNNFSVGDKKHMGCNKISGSNLTGNSNSNGNKYIVSNGGSNISDNSGTNTNSISNSKLEVRKNLKRKYNSNLINPNNKKIKSKGVKFITEEVEEDIEEMEGEDDK